MNALKLKFKKYKIVFSKFPNKEKYDVMINKLKDQIKKKTEYPDECDRIFINLNEQIIKSCLFIREAITGLHVHYHYPKKIIVFTAFYNIYNYIDIFKYIMGLKHGRIALYPELVKVMDITSCYTAKSKKNLINEFLTCEGTAVLFISSIKILMNLDNLKKCNAFYFTGDAINKKALINRLLLMNKCGNYKSSMDYFMLFQYYNGKKYQKDRIINALKTIDKNYNPHKIDVIECEVEVNLI